MSHRKACIHDLNFYLEFLYVTKKAKIFIINFLHFQSPEQIFTRISKVHVLLEFATTDDRSRTNCEKPKQNPITTYPIKDNDVKKIPGR